MWSCINNCETCKWMEYKDELPFCILSQKQVALFWTCFMFSSLQNIDINLVEVNASTNNKNP
ncbi:MAG: hypothetical protein IJX99_06480 [Clostridia bacterium]|nr:hypothetical protein [Clostridia bacterium]